MLAFQITYCIQTHTVWSLLNSYSDAINTIAMAFMKPCSVDTYQYSIFESYFGDSENKGIKNR